MTRLTGALFLLLGMTLAARGHFVFIVPADGNQAQVVFSDDFKPDLKVPIKKIAHTRFSALVEGKSVSIEAKTGKNALTVEAPGKTATWVAGVCSYGVIAKGKEPFLLTYYARALVGAKGGTRVKAPAIAAMKLDVLPDLTASGGPVARVLWEGKPLAGAEVVLYVPGKDESETVKTDASGQVKLPVASSAGTYGIRARHLDERKGKLDDKEYASARTYATCLFPVAGARSEASPARKVLVKEKRAGNPEASKLLADARAARANWVQFPGFTADVAVNVEGKVTRGKVKVSSKGKVDLDLEGGAKDWARRMLSSIVGHRLDDSTTLNTPCAFLDEVVDHPLGRSIKVLEDEFHSSYRIRDHQVIEVNRRMKDTRFTITVLENRLTPEKKYLPASYVVNSWDLKTDVLKSSVTHHNTWQRVGKYDLPLLATVLTATAGKQETRTIKLTGCKLLE